MRTYASWLGALTILLAFGGCAKERADSAGSGTGALTSLEASTCQDDDGDGFGEGCDLGADCNDDDDTIGDECSCMAPAEGCGCEEDSEPVECELSDAELRADSELCRTGMRYCRDGAWTGCVGVAAFSD